MPPLSPRVSQLIVTSLDHLEFEDATTIEKTLSMIGTERALAPLGHADPASFEEIRKVRFSEDLRQIHSSLHIRDYTFREKRETWYSLHELKSFKKDRRATTKRMNEGLECEGKYCTRGLEGSTTVAVKIRHQVIEDSIEAVLKEQTLQEESNSINPNRIARAYVVHSLPCQMTAYERGLCYQEVSKDEQDDRVSIYIEETVSILMESDDEQPDDSSEELVLSWKRS